MKLNKHRTLRLLVATIVAALSFTALSNGSAEAWPMSTSPTSRAGMAGGYLFQVGKPGPGQIAPPIRLPSTSGGTFDLAALRGKVVLLYFQEGLTCQACWDQLKDIETHFGEFKALGIDAMVSITTNPLDLLKQKVRSEHLHTPVLSDPNLVVSRAYHANEYGMMGPNYDGHSFIVVGRDGRILWRADYGGAPKYIMYVPVPDLLADIRRGLAKAAD